MNRSRIDKLIASNILIVKSFDGFHWGWLFHKIGISDEIFFADEDAKPGAGGSIYDYPFSNEDFLKIRSLLSS